MANLYPNLSVGVVPGLGEDPSIEGGLKSWILSGAFQPNSSANASQIELAFSDFRRLVRYLSFDFERFSLSSRETYVVALIEKDRHNLVGWPLLKLYYSAFFAAHAIMRSQGLGFVKLEKAHTDYLNSITSILYPQSELLTPGMFRYSIVSTDNTSALSIRLEREKKDGGAHEGFWKFFTDYLIGAATAAVKNKAANANEFLTGAADISRAIRGENRRAGLWFSTIRNEINYQHLHDAWFPIKKNSRAFICLSDTYPSISGEYNFSSSADFETLPQFSLVCRYLIILNLEISESIAAKSTKGKSFGQNWRRLHAILR